MRTHRFDFERIADSRESVQAHFAKQSVAGANPTPWALKRALIVRLRGAHEYLQVGRDRHCPEGADVGSPGVARRDQAEGGFCSGADDTEKLPGDLPAAPMAQPPAHHQDMCLGVQPG